MHQGSAGRGLDVSRLRSWVALLRKTQPDLVHVRGLGNEGFHGGLAARLAGCPRVLVSIHGTVRDLVESSSAKQQVIVHGLEPATLRFATHVTTVCEYAAKRDFVRRHRKKLVGPIVNGVEEVGPPTLGNRAGTRIELDIPLGALVVISVGRLSMEKGHKDLTDALARLPASLRESVVMVVVGDGPDSARIQPLYERSGVGYRMLGRRLDVSRLLGCADLFVFPSLHENLSNALLEAMAHGLPVVATRVGGNTEVLRDGAGLLVEARDPQGLADTLERVLRSDSMRKDLGATARRTVSNRYSIAQMCAVLDRTYQEILSDRRP